MVSINRGCLLYGVSVKGGSTVAEEVIQDILGQLEESSLFSIHTDIMVHQQCGIMLRYFDNTEGKG